MQDKTPEITDNQVIAITTAYVQGMGKGLTAGWSNSEIENPYSSEWSCDAAWRIGYNEGKKRARQEPLEEPEAVAVPDGWKLVPIVPTEAMLIAFMSEGEEDAARELDQKLLGELMERAGMQQRYANVLAAAPALAATPADHIADAGKMVAAPAGWKLVPVQVPDSAFPWVSGGYSTDYRAHDPRDQKIIEDRAQRTWEAILDGIAATPAAVPDRESVLIDGTAYDVPAAVAGELLRLHLEILAVTLAEEARTSDAGLKRFLRAANDAGITHLPKSFGKELREHLETAATPAPQQSYVSISGELKPDVSVYSTPASVPVVLPEPDDYKQEIDSKNCMQCSVAYLLGLPLHMVPDFAAQETAQQSWELFESFIASQGYAAVMLTGIHEFETDYLASGTSPRGIPHMVVMNDGNLVHDPHPSNAGLSDVQCIWLVTRRALLAAATGLPAQAVPINAEITWPKARDVGRIGDMSQVAHIRVGFDSDNDVFVSVWDENGGGSIEFCNPGGGGGGQSSRTRMALIALMVAMEADNAEKPSRDWWAQSAAIAAAKGESQ